MWLNKLLYFITAPPSNQNKTVIYSRLQQPNDRAKFLDLLHLWKIWKICWTLYTFLLPLVKPGTFKWQVVVWFFPKHFLWMDVLNVHMKCFKNQYMIFGGLHHKCAVLHTAHGQCELKTLNLKLCGTVSCGIHTSSPNKMPFWHKKKNTAPTVHIYIHIFTSNRLCGLSE